MDTPSVCRYCGKCLKSKSGLRQHELRHTGQGTYTCCDKLFFSKANLKRHECNAHGADKSHVCLKCGKSFPTNADLTKHIRREDMIDGLECDICGIVKADKKKKLKDHMDSHTGLKCHQCVECGKWFRFKGNVSRHMKIHKK